MVDAVLAFVDFRIVLELFKTPMDISTSPVTAEGLVIQGTAVFGHRNK